MNRGRLVGVLTSAAIALAGCFTETPGVGLLDRARREASLQHWKAAMTEAQSALRERPENREARTLLEEVAPRVWVEWESDIDRRSEYSTCTAAVSQESIMILKYLRDGERYESCGMLGLALENFREAETRLL